MLHIRQSIKTSMTSVVACVYYFTPGLENEAHPHPQSRAVTAPRALLTSAPAAVHSE